MKKLKNIFIAASLVLLTACSSTPTSTPTQTTTFQPHIIQRLDRKEISNLPPLSDINKSEKLLYFLVQSGDKVELKKRDLSTNKEELVRIFPYNHKILKFSIAADETHIAFMAKENDQFIVYITDLGGERLIKVKEIPASKGGQQLDAENLILKRVGLKHKFFFTGQLDLGCGGEILSYVSHHIVVSCSKNTEIIPEEQLLIVKPKGGEISALKTTVYEGSVESKEIMELPFKENTIQNIQLINEKTLRITTEKEYIDIQFKE